MKTKVKLKLGTRKSLLAWAQSSWVARKVEALNPEVQVELIGIETRGDRVLDVSLQNVQGKEFFVAEIDHALQKGDIDFSVHSLKDLSLDRPDIFTCAAIPKRENPRDVVLFGPSGLEKIKAGKPIRIGTSSPRRLVNIPPFLNRALPRFPHSSRSQVEFVEIRGNVNTRLSRVHENPHSNSHIANRYLDGVVLAFAGLIRLWANSDGKAELEKLLNGVKWMVLPLNECPAAPGQGALAVECRSQDANLISILKRLEDPLTVEHVRRERTLLGEWGGGCHQKFGATAIQVKDMEEVFFVRGIHPQGHEVAELRWNLPEPPGLIGHRQDWDGSQFKGTAIPRDLDKSIQLTGKAVFVAHSRAASLLRPGVFEDSTRVWTSGVSSWYRLADAGIWVEGCAEGFGFESLVSTLKEPVLRLPGFPEWAVLTHEQAVTDWKHWGIPVYPTYKINLAYRKEVISELQQATHVFWSSGSQFDELKEYVKRDAHHACGPGKTASRLRGHGLSPSLFPSVEEWRKWIKNSNTHLQPKSALGG